MSSVWEAPASGDAEWEKQDNDGPEEADGDDQGWTSNADAYGWPSTAQDNDNQENVDPHSSEHGAERPAAPGEDQDFACRNCGETGHFARQCPNAEAQKCFNCGEEGHNKAECPNPEKPRACFNCGEEGHNKADCPKPRVFKGACRICSQEGHPASACPEKPADICKNCRGEGHLAHECKENRKFDLGHIADRLPEEAWEMMKKASNEKDMDDFREVLTAIQIYTKAVPDATYVDIEKKMREEGFKIFLIALEKEREDVISLIDLQGQLDREFVVGYFFSDKPMRANLEQRWPSDADDNIERLANAGLPYDRQIIKCRNCGELGHGSRACKQERPEVEKLEIKCTNCGTPGHRVRDCTEPRRSQYGCRNCGAEGHEARDCPEPRAAGDVECRRCNEVGHFAKDCPNQTERAPRTCRNCGSEDHIARDCDQPPNPDLMVCRNCEKTGHAARDCPEPKDWSKVKCNRCGEMGHTVKRCPQPEENEFEAFGGEEPSYGQADYGQGDEVEDVRQRMEHSAW
ncbi:uncharacterized protein N7458_005439 [Penicillium daleae]|uniref:CCHC-type domain-containing protein n=1 Tax=Penicillium daleae TaxID=63821 RepID=A0AAD6C8W8_9EURO|nr:uncharacterized protein N7458_005439 [Penicillium daleae]KAJ5454483.1 hypothetical protein N7458_005439 [Penicillium daleae]